MVVEEEHASVHKLFSTYIGIPSENGEDGKKQRRD
jgi:hypothetical protein